MNDTIKDLADFAKMTSTVLRESGDSTFKAIADALDLSQVEIKRLVAINAELVEALEKTLNGEWTIQGDIKLLDLIEKAKQ